MSKRIIIEFTDDAWTFLRRVSWLVLGGLAFVWLGYFVGRYFG